MTTPPEPPNQEKRCMRTEADRLTTFEGWPRPFLKPAHLAKAGFYYTKKEDIVKCAFCNVELGRWQPGDDITTDHRKWSPNCIFLLREGAAAMPSNASSDSGEDTCGRFGIQMKPNSLPEGVLRANLNGLVIQQSRAAVYPQYAIHDNRLLSFTEWPRSLKQKPADLADAGFFYTGKGDQTMCFHCGGGLKDWEENDIPWEQHALWFPKCNYLLLKKSREYVDEINNRKPTEATATLSTTPPPSTSTLRKPEETATTPTKPPSLSEVAAAAVVVSEKTTKESDVASSASNSSANTLCKICYAKEVGVVFLPCGHVVACVECAPALSQCAVCRKPLAATIRAFLS